MEEVFQPKISRSRFHLSWIISTSNPRFESLTYRKNKDDTSNLLMMSSSIWNFLCTSDIFTLPQFSVSQLRPSILQALLFSKEPDSQEAGGSVHRFRRSVEFPARRPTCTTCSACGTNLPWLGQINGKLMWRHWKSLT